MLQRQTLSKDTIMHAHKVTHFLINNQVAKNGLKLSNLLSNLQR